MIHIIGAGFAGLALAWHLLQSGAKAALYDKRPIGQGTSGIAAGLLHPYSRSFRTKRPFAKEGMEASLALIHEAQKFSKSILLEEGLLRLPSCPFGSPCHYDTVRHEFSFLKRCYTVDCNAYLKALLSSCMAKGLIFKEGNVNSLEDFPENDKIAVTAGFETTLFPQLSHLPIKPLKGQIAEVKLPFSLPYSFTGGFYLSKQMQAASRQFLGATFERGKSNLTTNKNDFEAQIRPKWEEWEFSSWNAVEILELKAGVRATTQDRLPIMKPISDRYFILSGFGSKGLLYHALFAKKLAQLIMSQEALQPRKS